MGLCLLDCGCTAGLHHILVHFGLFDCLSSPGLILAHGEYWHSVPALFSAGVHGGLSHEQLLQGHIYLPLQLKYVIWQVSWNGPGESLGLRSGGRCWLPLEFSALVGRDGEWLTWMMLGLFSGLTTCGDACEEVAIRSGMARVHPIQAKWICCSGGWQSSQGRRWQLPSRCAMLPEAVAEVVGKVCCSHSKAPWRCRLKAMAVMSCGGLTAGQKDGTGVVMVASGFHYYSGPPLPGVDLGWVHLHGGCIPE